MNDAMLMELLKTIRSAASAAIMCVESNMSHEDIIDECECPESELEVDPESTMGEGNNRLRCKICGKTYAIEDDEDEQDTMNGGEIV